jgi:hypothetical protein
MVPASIEMNDPKVRVSLVRFDIGEIALIDYPSSVRRNLGLTGSLDLEQVG